MAKPNSEDARLFYRCALHRYDEAEVLIAAGYTTGAVYLAGYSIECILKSLVLSAVSPSVQKTILKTFRGTKAHDYGWLRVQYLSKGGVAFPREVTRHFTLVNHWSTDLRYTPRFIRADEAEEFLISTHAIIQWAQGRL